MTSKIFYLVFFVVFACCTTVTAVGDHSGGQNDDSNAKFNQQNSPSYTRDQQVSLSILINIYYDFFRVFNREKFQKLDNIVLFFLFFSQLFSLYHN